MKITVTRAELRTMSAGFAKIVPGKSSIPALGCVRLDVRPDGLVAHATDLDQRASYRFERPRSKASARSSCPSSSSGTTRRAPPPSGSR